jgi:beta-lactamase class C
MTRRDLFASFALAMQQARYSNAVSLVDKAIAAGAVAAAGLYIRQGRTVIRRGFGQAASPDTVFLLASITKPMTAAGLMILADRGQVSLDDRVSKHIPEFRGGDRGQVTLRHLLTHTSGLPDMLPENTELRKRHAGLRDFVAGACRTPLLFKPGAECRYQSMGILLAAEIAERVTGAPFRQFLRRELFAKLGLKQTSLGLGGRRIAATAQCEVTGDDDWNWNSPYWRDLGAPWGGAHSTPGEVARFLAMFQNPDNGILKPETTAAMIRDQNQGLNKPWAIGWMVQAGAFGKSCSPRTFGHWGSTGTVAWHDAAKDLTCVLLTTKPAEQSRAGLLGPVSDAVSAA